MTFFCRFGSLGGQKWFHKSVLHKNGHLCNVLCDCSCNGSEGHEKDEVVYENEKDEHGIAEYKRSDDCASKYPHQPSWGSICEESEESDISSDCTESQRDA